MTEPDTLPPNVHPVVALLPWYLNGTLSISEQATVSAHLRECPSCRTEVDDLVRMNEQIKQAVETAPLPSPSLAQTILSRIREDTRQSERNRAAAQNPMHPNSLISQIDHWLRDLLALPWIPTVVSALVITQLGLMTWSLIQTPAARVEPSGAITSRGLGTPTVRLTIAFQPVATMQDIQSLLLTVHARVIDGPTADGAYTIEVPASGPASLERQVTSLQSRTDIIRHLEMLTP